MRRNSFLVVVVLTLVGPLRAQWNSPMPTRVELLKSGVQAAEGFVQKQEIPKARFCLLAVTELFDKCRQACPADVQQTFAKVMAAALPEPVTDANAAQEVRSLPLPRRRGGRPGHRWQGPRLRGGLRPAVDRPRRRLWTRRLL
ncbi:MAG: hypothetical protein IT204_23365 [Fimbriimonadaceae bacterium]|nr:hypothetical protein [Fimbriimonadaceae bacterium]